MSYRHTFKGSKTSLRAICSTCLLALMPVEYLDTTVFLRNRYYGRFSGCSSKQPELRVYGGRRRRFFLRKPESMLPSSDGHGKPTINHSWIWVSLCFSLLIYQILTANLQQNYQFDIKPGIV